LEETIPNCLPCLRAVIAVCTTGSGLVQNISTVQQSEHTTQHFSLTILKN